MKQLGYTHKSGVSRAPAIPFIALAVAVIGAGVGTYSAIQQSSYQKGMAKYQAGVASNNELYAKRAAEQARIKGEEQARDQRVKAATLISDQAAGLAGNGVDVTGASSVGTFNDTFNAGEQDAMTIQQNANRQALGYEQQGANFSAQAQADAASGGGSYDFLGTAFSGVGSVANKWYQLDQQGAFSGSFINGSGGFAAPSTYSTNTYSGMISGGV